MVDNIIDKSIVVQFLLFSIRSNNQKPPVSQIKKLLRDNPLSRATLVAGYSLRQIYLVCPFSHHIFSESAYHLQTLKRMSSFKPFCARALQSFPGSLGDKILLFSLCELSCPHIHPPNLWSFIFFNQWLCQSLVRRCRWFWGFINHAAGYCNDRFPPIYNWTKQSHFCFPSKSTVHPVEVSYKMEEISSYCFVLTFNT
jgi:hypothetical protein